MRIARTSRLLPHLVLAALFVATAASADVPHGGAPDGQYKPFDIHTEPDILDLKTTIDWQRTPYSAALSYSDALNQCNLGFAGGHPPTVKELLTIVAEQPHQEYQSVNNVTKMIDGDAFPGTFVDHPYWTSTPDLNGATNNLAVDFGTGLIVSVDRTLTAYVRCVK